MAALEISRIRIIPFDTGGTGGRTRAMAEVEFAGALRVRGFRIVETEAGGLFVAMPSVRGRDGRYRELVSPTDREFARQLRERILTAYRTEGLPTAEGGG